MQILNSTRARLSRTLLLYSMDSALRAELRGRRLRRYLAEKQQRLRMPTYLPRVPPQY